MTADPADLVARAEAMGFRLVLAGASFQAVPCGPDAVLPPSLMAELKADRLAILARLKRLANPAATCRVCQRDVSDPEDRERLRGANPFCDAPRCPLRGEP